MNYLVILLEMKNNALITIGFLIISNIIACQTENIKPATIMSDKKYNSLTKEEERVIISRRSKDNKSLVESKKTIRQNERVLAKA